MVRSAERRGDESTTKPAGASGRNARGTRTEVAVKAGAGAKPSRQMSSSPAEGGDPGGKKIQARPASTDARRVRLLRAAEGAGLLDGPKDSQLGARFPRSLVEEARRKSGLTETTELLTYALTKVALEDDYGERLLARKGRIPEGILVVED